MKRSLLVLGLLIGCAVLSEAQSAYAQGGGRSRPYPYMPARPVMSPYFGLFRRDGGPLGPYHTYVLPQARLRDTLATQAQGIYRAGAGIQYLSGEVARLDRASAGNPVTGTGSVFMNHSHYYAPTSLFDPAR